MLAPMAELSHRALRELIDEFGGCDEYFTEMISAPALLAGGPFEKWYMDNGPCPDKVVYQLVGAEIASLARAAALLNERECAGIDINMGCSAPLIRKSGAGVAWMASPDKAGHLVKEVRKAVKRRLSVKLRTGFTEDFEYLVNFCRRLEAEGVDLIILHPRTASEKFKRLAKWSYVEALRRELQIPVAGNGDIACAQDIILKTGGINAATAGKGGVMAGRATVQQPWIFAQAKKVTDTVMVTDTVLEGTGVRFLELLAQHQPQEFHISRAKRFFGFYCNNLKWGNYLINRLNREETLSGIEKVWTCYFRENT